jgi:hypothetical protein
MTHKKGNCRVEDLEMPGAARDLEMAGAATTCTTCCCCATTQCD